MHVFFTLNVGGMEKQAVNVINLTDSARFRHSICCFEMTGTLADRLTEPRPPIHLIEKRPGIPLSLPLRLARFFRRERVDIVHARSFGTYLYSAIGAAIARKKIVYGEHGDLRMMLGNRKVRMAMRLLRPFTHAYYANTGAGQGTISQLTGEPSDRIGVIPNGVETEVFRPGNAVSARRLMGVPEDSFVIGFVGRVAAVKNLKALFDVLPAVKDLVRNATVVIVGDGPDMENVRRMAAVSPIKTFLLGERRDISELLPGLSVVVLPSLSEGHSNSISEAFASGCPVVASRVGGNIELVNEGQTGFLFPVERTQEFGERLIELAMDEARRSAMAANARQFACDNLSMEQMIHRYEGLYSSLAGGSR